MRVVVKVHESARTDYEAWLARLGQPPTGNAGVARVYAQELIRLLRDHEGVPPGAVFRTDLIPPRWVFRYSSDTWVEFAHMESRTGVWGGVIREVVITGLATHPPG